MYAVADDKPVTVTGEEDDDPVIDPGVEVAVYVEANPPPAFGVNATVAAPLLYARDVPTFVAAPIVGVRGITPSWDHPEDV